MINKLSGKLTEGLSLQLNHTSGSQIKTTATKDFGGDGMVHSPTDLFVSALGACSLISMAYYAKRNNIPLEDASFSIDEKEMKKAVPSRFTKIAVTYHIKTSASEADYKRLIHAAEMCPVRHSMHLDIELIEQFERE